MEKLRYLLLMLFLIFSTELRADDFLGAPLVDQRNTIQQTNSRLEFLTPMTHDEVLQFYRKALKEVPDIKIRDWKDASYIEDDGKLQWHSITISKAQKGEKTRVVILKDSWTWIIGTLILRYIGVFVVLSVLFMGMTISGSIISRSVKSHEGQT